MNRYNDVLSIVAQSDQLKPYTTAYSNLKEGLKAGVQGLGTALIDKSLTDIIERIHNTVGTKSKEVLRDISNKIEEKGGDFKQVLKDIVPEDKETVLDPLNNRLREIKTLNNAPQTDDNIVREPYTDDALREGIKVVQPDLDEDGINKAVELYNNKDKYKEDYDENRRGDLSDDEVDAERLVNREEISKIGQESINDKDVLRALENRNAPDTEKALEVLKDTDKFKQETLNLVKNVNTAKLSNVSDEEYDAQRLKKYEKLRKQGEQLRKNETSRELETEGEEVEGQLQKLEEPSTIFKSSLGETSVLSRAEATGNAGLQRQLLEQRQAIQKQLNNLKIVPEEERGDVPFLTKQKISNLPEPEPAKPPPTIKTEAIQEPSKEGPVNVEAEAGEDVGRKIEKKAVSKTLDDLTEESTAMDESPIGDILTLGLGLASIFVGGIKKHDHHGQPLQSSLLNPSYQMGI